MADTVLGIDPGTQHAGWALLGRDVEGGPRHVASGRWRLGGGRVPLPERLHALRSAMCALLADHRPELLAVEAAFFGKNARSALRLGEARGVVLATAQEHGLAVVELAPARVKTRVAGTGAARKEQVARLVAAQLGLPDDFASNDESDAVAVALCGLLETADGLPRAAPAAPRSGLPRGARWQ